MENARSELNATTVQVEIGNIGAQTPNYAR